MVDGFTKPGAKVVEQDGWIKVQDVKDRNLATSPGRYLDAEEPALCNIVLHRG